MQLQGPLKLNSYKLFASKDQPVQAVWRDEREDKGYLVESLAGRKKYVSKPRIRGRIRFGFDGLSKNEALRVLFELRKGRLTLTPRVNRGGGGAIDVDGDGIPDFILEEVELPVRVVSGIPSTSPLYRTSGGEIVNRIDEIEVETTQTYEQIPGLAEPPAITYKAYAEYPNSVTLDNIDAWTVGLNLTPGVKMFVDWDDGTTETAVNPTHEYPPDGGPYNITAVLFSSKLDLFEWRGDVLSRPDGSNFVRIDVSPTEFGTIEADEIDLSPLEEAVSIGTLTDFPETTTVRQNRRSSVDYDASTISRDNTNLRIITNGPTGDVMNLPSDQKEATVRCSSLSQDVVQAGGPVGPSTTIVDFRNSEGPTLGSDFQSASVDNNGPAPNVKTLRTSFKQSGTEIAAIMRTMRKLTNFRGIDGFADLRDKAIPPSMTSYLYDNAGLGHAGSDYSWMSHVNTFRISPNGESTANSITNGTAQFPRLWRAFYNNRSNIPDIISVDQSFRTGGSSPAGGIYCEATDPKDLWKMVGLRGFHPNNASSPASVFDATTALALGNLLSFSADSYTSSSVTFSWSVPSRSSVTDSNGNLTAAVIYAYDDSAGDELIARVEKNGSRQWMPIFQSGEQMRYEESGRSKLFEIAGHTYDPSADEATISINTSSSQTGTDSNPSEAADLVYAFYFQSQP